MNSPLITRRESIVLTSIDIIDEIGIEALSIRTIASREKIVESSIYKHFKSKEEIILEVLDYYSKYDESLMDTIQFNHYGAKESIIFFIESLITNYEAHPALTSITQSFEALKNSSPAVDKARDIFFKRIAFISSLVKEAKSEGVFSQSLSNEFIATTIVGIKRTVLTEWRMSNYSFKLKERALKYILDFLEMCKA